jgi:nucleotide-binding universal stress UspA family protein
VLDAAHCPVVVAPHGWHRQPRPPARLGVGYDDTPRRGGALDAAAELARGLNASLHVIDVIEPAAVLDVEPPIAVRSIGGSRERARERLEHAIAGLGVPATVELRFGAPDEQLAACSAETDLLVVGSHARGALGRLLYGRGSGALVRQARCPVMVVPTRAPQPPLSVPVDAY